MCQNLHKNKFRPYKIHLVHELNEDNYDRGLEFIESIMNRIDNGTFRLNKFFFTKLLLRKPPLSERFTQILKIIDVK